MVFRKARRLVLAAAPLPALAMPAALAQTEAELPPVIVSAPAEPPPPAAASEILVPAEALRARPAARTGELLEAAPGLIVSQHSGEGKANQYFLRGVNLDHGTDLAISVDGMPVNMRTHAHGQGYADIAFVIPELLGGLHVRKGPYFADLGDFSAAGALRLDLVDALERPFVQATAGSFGHWRGLAAGSRPLGAGTLLGALEVAGQDGPWRRPEELRRVNGVLRWSQGTPADGLAVTAMAYAGHWHATDQIPERAVAQGLIGRFGTLDPTDGGRAQRYSLSARWSRTGDWGTTRVTGYVIRSALDLYNNFTYRLDEPERGDQFQQRDRRWVAGFDAQQAVPHTLLGWPAETRFGLQARHDDIRLGLFRTEARDRFATVREDAVRQSSAGLWADTTVHWTPWLRGSLGLRGDIMGGRVRSDLAANSGAAEEAILSPKAGLVLGPFAGTELFLNAGTGFHSNDLRGATISVDPTDRLTTLSRVPLLVRAKGAEAGLRTRGLAEGLESSLSVFVLTLASELVFVGDAGTTEATRASRRIGVEWTNRWQPLPWMALDLDLAATRARYAEQDGTGRRIPGAPNLVAAAGLVLDQGGPEGGWFGAARLRLFGPRPLVEDDSLRSRTTALVNARAGYRFANGVRVQLDAFNLLNAKASQIDYAYASRLAGEPAAGVTDRHFHPVEPLALRVTVTVPL